MEPTSDIPNKSIIITAAVVLILLAGYWFFWRAKPEEKAVENLSEALQETSEVSAPRVPTSVNPIKEILPKENPLEKTNPFNYVNPFE